MDDSFPQIRAAAVDERAHTVFYRQTQLERLCQTLIARVPDIRQAIAADYGHSSAEIALEIHLALAAVKRDYASLQPSRAHKEEYLVAAGKDAPAGKRPAKIVYIEPCMHTLFYSVVAPLSAAITAGNCVILLLENNLHALSSVLRQILISALGKDTFAIASSPIRNQGLLNSIIIVNQNNNEQWPRANQLASAAARRTVAVVDRTANIRLAAHELVAARSSFGGRSPYAPDCVLVNEFVKQSFLQAVITECVQLGTGNAMNGHAQEKSAAADARVPEQVESLKRVDPDLRIISQEQKMTVVELSSCISDLVPKKIDAPVLVIHAIRSLDDAINLINSTGDGVCLAAYHFGNPAAGKYLTQFVDANISFVDSVPREILVGPAFPTAHPINPAVRYPVDLFSVQRPAYTRVRPSSVMFDAALASPNNASAQKLLEDATTPLRIMKRSEGGAVGFFEQGFFLFAALLLLMGIIILGVGVYWLVKHDWSLW